MRGGSGGLERELRAARSEPRADFLAALARHALESEPRRALLPSRIAFGLALTVFVVGSFASFGGLSYAASEADSAVKVVKSAVHHHAQRVKHNSSAMAQYVSPPPPVSTTSGESANAGAPLGETAAKSGGNLPFTGISLVVTAVIGFALLTLGLVLKGREKRQE